MINLYSGTPGSGKSFHSAKDIKFYLNRGVFVISNVDINLNCFSKTVQKKIKKYNLFKYVRNEDLTPQFLKDFSKNYFTPFKENECLLVIDECSTFFNSRNWDKKDRSDWILFLQQHRKLGFNIVLICQCDRMIDRQIRGFIETEYKHRSLKNLKTFGFLLNFFFGGLFIVIEYYYPIHLKCGSKFLKFSPRVAKLYDTFTIYE